MVSGTWADIFQVIVFAPGPYTLLNGDGALVGRVPLASEVVFKLVHARIGEEKGGVVLWDQGRGRNFFVTLVFEKGTKCVSQVLGRHPCIIGYLGKNVKIDGLVLLSLLTRVLIRVMLKVMLSVLRNRLSFVLLISLAFAPALEAESYRCLDNNSKGGHLITWTSSKVVIDRHMHFSIHNNRTLEVDSPGGSSNIRITPEEVFLEYIQDTSQFKLERPSGKIIRNDFDKKMWEDIRSRGYAVDYHAIVPTHNVYIFDRQKKTLAVRHKTLPPRMSADPERRISTAQQREFRYNTERKSTRDKFVRYLEQDEAIRIFAPSEKFSQYSYPKCKKMKESKIERRWWHDAVHWLLHLLP